MRHRSLLILTTVLTTGALTLTACGSRDDDNKSDGNSSSGNTTVVIGVDAPLTGDLSALGLGIKNSADLAVNIANKKKLVPGVTFKVQPLDDQAQPSVGGQNAQKFIDNKDVLGVVGPLNSSVSQSMQKPLNDATLTQVSPPTPAPS